LVEPSSGIRVPRLDLPGVVVAAVGHLPQCASAGVHRAGALPVPGAGGLCVGCGGTVAPAFGGTGTVARAGAVTFLIGRDSSFKINYWDIPDAFSILALTQTEAKLLPAGI
jgi:hypothetical protein